MLEGRKRPYTFYGLKNFGECKKMTQKEKTVKRYYQSTAQFLAKVMQWCRIQNIPPCDVQQFISVPLTIADFDGLPIQKQKVDGRNYLKKHFKSAFLESIKSPCPKTLILDGLVLINKYRPQAVHRTFGEYAGHLFKKCISDNFKLKGYNEIHLAFDRQTFDIITPKCIERDRRDKEKNKCKPYDEVDLKTHTPWKWDDFLANRANKKKLVNFLCEQFIKLGSRLLHNRQTLIVSGGFKQPGMANAVVHSEEEEPFNFRAYCNNHVEADSMVFLHAVNCNPDNAPILIFSIDTDILFIGLHFACQYPDRHFLVHYKSSAGVNNYVDLNKLLDLMSVNSALCTFDKCQIADEMQALYVCSGCDYVSFFNHYSKNTFFDAYFDNVEFISAESLYSGQLSQADEHDWELGFRAFCRLIGCVFITKCSSSFQYKMKFLTKPSPRDIYDKVCEEHDTLSEQELLQEWLDQIRTFIMQSPECTSEQYWLPSHDSLMLHWKRCCYVLQIWKQSDLSFMKYPDTTQWGWSFVEKDLVFRWDSDANFRKVEKYRKLWTSGCKCRSVTKPCNNRTCGCRKSQKPCGPACACADTCHNKASDPSVEGLLQAIHPDTDDSEVVKQNLAPMQALINEESDDCSEDVEVSLQARHPDDVVELAPVPVQALTDEESDGCSDEEI